MEHQDQKEKETLLLRLHLGRFKRAKYKRHKCILVFKNASLEFSWDDLKPALLLYDLIIAKSLTAGPFLTEEAPGKSPVYLEKTSSGIKCRILLPEPEKKILKLKKKSRIRRHSLTWKSLKAKKSMQFSTVSG